MATKIIGVLLLICAGLIFQFTYDDLVAEYLSPAVKLKRAIEQDILDSLSKENVNTKVGIRSVKFVHRSTDALSILSKNPPQFQTTNEGGIWLEVEVLDLDDSEKPGFITQTSVFDVSSNNKISEFGQTYLYREFDEGFKPAISNKKPILNTNSKLPENGTK